LGQANQKPYQKSDRRRIFSRSCFARLILKLTIAWAFSSLGETLSSANLLRAFASSIINHLNDIHHGAFPAQDRCPIPPTIWDFCRKDLMA
jgi:hypothetical protein